MKEIADKIKDARERKHLTLQEISYDTKIPVNLLKAIENGERDVFQSEFYARSFMKTYADFLGISLSDYELREAISPEKEQEGENELNAGQKTTLVRSRKSFSMAIIFLAAVVFIAVYKMPVFHKDPVLETRVPDPRPVAVQTAVMIKAIVHSDTWIKVICDDAVVEETILIKGDEKFWEADRRMKIRVGYTKGLDLYHKTSPAEEYVKIDINEGSSGEVNEIELINESAE